MIKPKIIKNDNWGDHMNINDYWILQSCGEDDSAVINSFPDDQVEGWELHQATPLLSRVNEPVKLSFSLSFPSRIQIYDFIANTLNLLIVSSKVKTVLNEFGINKLEWIPTHIFDHQNKLVSNDYQVINVLDRQPIVDMKKSSYVLSPINEDVISNFNQLHLSLENIDSGARFFSPTNKPGIYMITTEVVKKLASSNVTGLDVIRAEGWNGMTLKF